jgi:cobalamin biosynthesis protein CobT
MAVKGVQRRILITIDDGEPYPCIAPNVYNMQGRHISYLREVVKSLTAAKVEVLGMGMGTYSVASYYPASVVVNDMATFPTVALSEMKKLLTKKS